MPSPTPTPTPTPTPKPAPTATPSRSHRRLRTAGALLALTALFAACAPGATDESTPSPTETVAEIPATPVGEQAQWVIDELNAAEPASGTEVESRFDPVMFEELTVEDLQAVFDDLRAAQPWTPTAYEGTETQAQVAITAAETALDMSVSVAADGRMNGLYFAPAQPERTPAASWDELRDELEAAPYDATLTVHRGGEEEVAIGDTGPAPIGSIFKLYVLGAVVDAVASGTLSWEQSLTIDAEVRSLPSGELQDEPDGTTVTVLDAAQKMIEISDNTATDLLIRAVGRDAVEAALADLGHADPALNTPFAATREFFWIGWGDPALREQWAEADDRDAVLAAVPDGVPDPATGDWTVAAWQSGVDWFATPADLARAHAGLQELSQTDAGAPVRGILSANPGIDLGDDWTYVGFKGGSSAGVMAGSWYLERDGAEPVVLTLLARSDDVAAVSMPTTVFAVVPDAAALLAAE